MEREPKRLITRIVEYAALLALAVFLIKLAVCWLTGIWWVLVIIAVVAIGGVIGWRVFCGRKSW